LLTKIQAAIESNRETNLEADIKAKASNEAGIKR
jgi:hypothetical protein